MLQNGDAVTMEYIYMNSYVCMYVFIWTRMPFPRSGYTLSKFSMTYSIVQPPCDSRVIY